MTLTRSYEDGPVNIADKPLHVLSDDEWERLCDGCGRCCMQKFEDVGSGEMLYTRIACRLFDDGTCRCRDYEARRLQVPNCMRIRDFSSVQMRWLPESCAYRLRFEGKPLPAWHPLQTGDLESVHAAGMSMRWRSVCEDEVPEEEWPAYIILSDERIDG